MLNEWYTLIEWVWKKSRKASWRRNDLNWAMKVGVAQKENNKRDFKKQ